MLSKFAAIFILLTSFAQALTPGQYFHYQSLKAQKHLKSNDEKLIFDQKLDHQNPQSQTFEQRYFIDSTNAKTNLSPVFYIICGEWNCAGANSYSFISDLARRMGAHLVALEHRYYGESMPTNHLTTENLKYLSIEAALEDLKAVQTDIMQTRGMTGPWIAVGGSYAGTLSAFYRLKYPEMVTGSIASSGPVNMKNDFFEYDGHIASVVNKTACGDKVREAVVLIEDRMKTSEGVEKLKELFNAKEYSNDQDFLYLVADMLAAAVQYGRDKAFCNTILTGNDLVSDYAKAGLAALSSIGGTPYDDWMPVALKVDVTENDNMRQWLYQSCTQFGWFQVANGKGRTTSRSSQIDLGYHQGVCQRLFGIDMAQDGTMNESYYQKLFDPTSTRIIFPNGSNDPWMTLSIAEPNDQPKTQFDLVLMDGAAHCNDLRLTSNAAVTAGQSQIEKIVRSWVNENP